MAVLQRLDTGPLTAVYTEGVRRGQARQDSDQLLKPPPERLLQRKRETTSAPNNWASALSSPAETEEERVLQLNKDPSENPQGDKDPTRMGPAAREYWYVKPLSH